MAESITPASASLVDVKSPMTTIVESCATSPGKVHNITSADTGEVRAVSASEYKAAALSLAEAFREDEVARYFVDTPDRADWTEEQKWELHCQILEYITYAHCLKGLVTTVGPDYGAVALWMPPGKNMDDFFTVVRSGMWRLNYQLSAEGRKRFFNEFLPLLHKSKQEVLGERDDESWYLVYIGCRLSARGKGYARKLIDHVTAMADLEGRACYLESSNDVNPKIYAKMGFEIRKKIYLQRAEEKIALDLMVREPKRPNAFEFEKKTVTRIERI